MKEYKIKVKDVKGVKDFEEIPLRSDEEINLYSLSIYEGAFLLLKSNEKDYPVKKKEFLEFIVRTQANLGKVIVDRVNEYLNGLKRSLISYAGSNSIREVVVKLKSRGLIGLGSTFGKLPFEVGLSFHPYFNVPYIPASSIKGAVRSACYSLIYERSKRNGMSDEKSHMEAEKYCNEVFGGEVNERRIVGLVHFTDALPMEAGEKGFILYPDIINPHYKDVETELDVSPTPIVYLTIAPGTKFKFFIFFKDERKDERSFKRVYGRNVASIDPRPDMESLGWLDLSVLYAFASGVGAKTLIGYSIFEVMSYGPPK